MMTAETNSKKLRTDASKHMNKAYECLIEILKNEHTDKKFNKSYIDNIHKVSQKILKLERKI